MASGQTKKTCTHSEMRPRSTGATTGYEAQLWQNLHGRGVFGLTVLELRLATALSELSAQYERKQ